MAAPTPDGIAVGNRLDTLTERKLYGKVVDNILTSTTYAARLMGKGKVFMGKTFDYTVKITNSGLGEWFTGLETLVTSASDTTITMSWSHVAFDQPIVIPMLEAFGNAGQTGTIDLSTFKIEEAVGEAINKLGTAVYTGNSTLNQPDSLAVIVDDGTTYGTIGGQSRTTYTNLKANLTASGGTMTLAGLGALYDNCIAAGYVSEEPTIHLTTKAIWTNYEALLQPTVRAAYTDIGYNVLPVRGDSVVKSRDELKGAAGFTALTYRGMPVIRDDACTSQTWFMLNERYLEWRGRDIVPDSFSGQITKISLGEVKTTEGVMAVTDYNRPPKSYGWFYQKPQILPNQAGLVGRIYVIGQMLSSQPRRHGKLTGITGI